MEVLIAIPMLTLTLLVDIVTGEINKPRKMSGTDLWISIASTLLLFGVRVFLVLTLTFALIRLLPGLHDILGERNVAITFVAVLLLDDFLTYWLHRMSHQYPALWRLHKPHHTPTQLNALVGAREALLYYFIYPANFLAPILLFIGAAKATAIMYCLKVVTGYIQHMAYRWDLRARRYAVGRLFFNAVEAVFVLQDFHHAHHGLGRYGNASSNYGNVLTIWDRLFGTSRGHPRHVQDAIGLPVGTPIDAPAVQLFWPFFRPAKPKKLDARPLAASTEAELAAARATIFTADGLAIAVNA